MKRRFIYLWLVGVMLLLPILLTGCNTQASSESSKDLAGEAYGPTKKMSELKDIAEKRIGVYAGTIHDAFAEKNYPRAQIYRFNNLPDMVLALKNHKVDVLLFDLTAAKMYERANPEIGILSEEVLSLPVGIGFSKNNPELVDKFNLFLQTIRENGIYQEMFTRWHVQDPEKAVMPEIPQATVGKKVVLGVAVADLPNVSFENNKYIGFDIELMQRFAQHEGFQMEIKSMEFGALIASLLSGKVDMIADSVVVTEERQKQIAFSDKYLDFKTAAVVRKAELAGSVQREEAGVPTSLQEKISTSFYNNIIRENRYLLIIDGLKTTLMISLFSALFGTLLGALVCFLRMSRHRPWQLLSKIYIALLRGTPVLVLLMLIFYVAFASVDINPILVAVLAFGMNFAAYVAEMYRSGVEGVDKGQREAGLAMGFSKTQTFLNIVLPQAIKQILPGYKGEFISLVKMTSVVGYIAVQDLTKAGDIIRSRTFDAFFPLIMVAVLYFLISGVFLLGLEYLERRTDPRRKKRNIPLAFGQKRKTNE